MKYIFLLTLLLLTFSVCYLGYAEIIITPAYHSSFLFGMGTSCVPLFILAALVVFFRTSIGQSFVLLCASSVQLYAVIENCRPVFEDPDDLFFPLMGLVPIEFMIFALLIPILIIVHGLEILLRVRGLIS